MKQKKVFALQKSSTPTGLIWYTNMADFLLFRNTNMADMTSRENALLKKIKIKAKFPLASPSLYFQLKNEHHYVNIIYRKR